MSLEQYKDANRKELWDILQIQVERIAELEKENEWLFDFALGYTNAYFLVECLEALKETK